MILLYQSKHYVIEIKVPKKYQDDIKALRGMYGEDFKTGLCINFTLQEALKIMPKERCRVDAYTGLISFLKAKLGITLNIISQKTKEENYETIYYIKDL